MRADESYRRSVAAAAEHHVPHSEWLDWPEEDRDAFFAHRNYRDEECGECGVHPTLWDPKKGGRRDAVVPVWKFCRVCELLKQAQDAGPPTKSGGWHLTLQFNRPGEEGEDGAGDNQPEPRGSG